MGANEPVFIHQPWVQSLHEYVRPYWDHLLDGAWAEGVARGRLSLPEIRAART